MANKFRDLRKKMSSAAKEKVIKKTKKMLVSMPLYELRQAKHMSQEQLAEKLNKKQGTISRIEKQTDMYISTLRGYIEAMGGELDIIARFPDGEIHVSQFKDIN